jgi:hypothetical protein
MNTGIPRWKEGVTDDIVLAASLANVTLDEAVEVAKALKNARPTAKRPCAVCHRLRTPEGHDPCIANLPGVIQACCGHGVSRGYILMLTEKSTGVAYVKNNMLYRLDFSSGRTGPGLVMETPDGQREVPCSILSIETHKEAIDRFLEKNKHFIL